MSKKFRARVKKVFNFFIVLMLLVQPVGAPSMMVAYAADEAVTEVPVEAPVEKAVVETPVEKPATEAPVEKPVVPETSAPTNEVTAPVVEVPELPVVSEVPTPAEKTIDEVTTPEIDAIVVPEVTPIEKDCIAQDTVITTSQEADWEVNGDIAKTKEKVKLGVKYEFPGNKEVSVTFTCLPKDESKISALKIEQIAADKINLPEGIFAASDFAYDVNTDEMENGSFKYDLTLPKVSDIAEAEISYIEKSVEDVVGKDLINADLKTIDKKDVTNNDESVVATDINHFTILIATYSGSSFSTSKTSYLRGETVYANATGLNRSYGNYYRIDAIEPNGTTKHSMSACQNYISSKSGTYALSSSAVGGNWRVVIQRFDNSYDCSQSRSARDTGTANFTVVVPDTTAPIIAEVSPISTQTGDTTPSYIFTSNEAGTITLGGACTSSTTNAGIGNNTLTLNALVTGTYADCTVMVTDAATNQSNVLAIPAFTINTDLFEKGMVTLSFDDGLKNVYNNRSRLGSFKSTQYISTIDMLGATEYGPEFYTAYMNTAEILALYNAGHEIATHTRAHDHLTTTPNFNWEVDGSRLDLLRSIGLPVNNLAYPYGEYNENVKTGLKEAGIIGARTVAPDELNTRATDPYQLFARQVNANTSVATVQDWIDEAINNNQWLILVFHDINTACANPGGVAGDTYCATPTNLSSVVSYLQGKGTGVDVVTVKDGLARMENQPVPDGVAPVITQVDLVIQATSALGAPATFSPVVTDADGNFPTTLKAFCTIPNLVPDSLTGLAFPTVVKSGDFFPMGITTVTCTAADTGGKLATKIFTITVSDSAKPVITLIGNNPVNIAYLGTYTEQGATWTDSLDGTGNAVVGGDVVNPSAVGAYTVTYNYTDTNGNAADQVTRIVNVIDGTMPTATIVYPSAGTCFSAIVPTIGVNFTDDWNLNWAQYNIDGGTWNSIFSNVDSNNVNSDLADQVLWDSLTEGEHTVFLKVADDSGNIFETQAGQGFSVKKDTLAPDTSVSAGYYSFGTWTKNNIAISFTCNDAVSGCEKTSWCYDDGSTTCVPGESGNGFGEDISLPINFNLDGYWYLRYLSKDKVGNTENVQVKELRLDKILPVVTLIGGNVTITQGNSYSELGATWTDNIDGSGVVVNKTGTVNKDRTGNYQLTYAYTDTAGNTGTAVRTVTVKKKGTNSNNHNNHRNTRKTTVVAGTTLSSGGSGTGSGAVEGVATENGSALQGDQALTGIDNAGQVLGEDIVVNSSSFWSSAWKWILAILAIGAGAYWVSQKKTVPEIK